jgi:hypothetical protein
LRVGSFAGLQRLSILGWPWALFALLIQLFLHNPPIDRQAWAIIVGPWIWVTTLFVLLAVLLRNARSGEQARAAFGLAALGVGLNLFVVAANDGHMPQSAQARVVARPADIALDEAPPQLRNVAPIGPGTQFAWLGDVIAQPNWLPRANVVSIGDLLLSTALAWWAFKVISATAPGQTRGIATRGKLKSEGR